MRASRSRRRPRADGRLRSRPRARRGRSACRGVVASGRWRGRSARAPRSSCRGTARVRRPRRAKRPSEAAARCSRGVGMFAAVLQCLPSNTSVVSTRRPSAWPPTTTIRSPTTAAAPAARGRLSEGSSTHLPSRSANTRSEISALGSDPFGYPAADHDELVLVGHGHLVVQPDRQVGAGLPAVDHRVVALDPPRAGGSALESAHHPDRPVQPPCSPCSGERSASGAGGARRRGASAAGGTSGTKPERPPQSPTALAWPGRGAPPSA